MPAVTSQDSFKIRRRVVFLFFFLVSALFLPVLFFLRFSLLSSFEKTQERLLVQAHGALTAYIDEKKDSLLCLVQTAARLPDLTGLLSDSSLKREHRVELLFLAAADGRAGAGLTAADGFEEKASHLERLWVESGMSGAVGFLRDSRRQLWLIASGPVGGIAGSAVSEAYLVAGYRVDLEFFKTWSSQMGFSVNFFDEDAPAGVLGRWKRLVHSYDPFLFVRPQEGSRAMALDALIRDISGEAVGLLEIRDLTPPAVLVPARLVLTFAWLALALFCFSALVVFHFLTRRVVLPLGALRGAIQGIAEAGDLSGRLPLSDDHELGGLLEEFNRMLDVLAAAQERLSVSRDEITFLYRDLSEQKRFVSEILNQMPSIVLVLSPEGRVKYVNASIERVLGYKTEEVLGRDWFDHFLPFADRESIRFVFEDILKGRAGAHSIVENEILAKDGSPRPILWSNGVIKDAEGRLSAVVSLGQDVTEVMKNERALRKRADEMERFYKVALDREKAIAQLKNELRALKQKYEGGS